MSSFILVIDQGTTSSRALIFDQLGNVVSTCAKTFKQYFPKPSWVEHDPVEIWKTCEECLYKTLADAKLKPSDISAIGITNQRETVVVWDRQTGRPIHNAIVWQDRRTSAFMDSLQAETDWIRQSTGLPLDAYFSASKIKWILDNVPGARASAQSGALAAGTIDTWLVWNLTKGAEHITDTSNASRTMLADITTTDWSPRLLNIFDIPHQILPRMVPTSGICAHAIIDGVTIPIAGIVGDQQAATFGHLAITPGTAKNTYGTGCFLMMPTGTTPPHSNNGLLSTIAWTIQGKTTYALEGSCFIAGAAIEWSVNNLQIANNVEELNNLAASVEVENHVLFVPALAGLGAPVWDQYARGAFLGMTQATTRAHLARAIFEGIACQVVDIVKAAQSDSCHSDTSAAFTKLHVDGGVCKSDLLMQLQADLLNTEIIRPTMTELTAKGAAYLAGLSSGVWKSVDELGSLPETHTTFTPKMPATTRERILALWEKGVSRAKSWDNNHSE
jgi:glycerol kinase